MTLRPPGRSPPPPSPRKHLLADHRRIEAMQDDLVASLTADRRAEFQRLWTILDASLLAHFETEENLLISELARSCPRDARALLEEHRHLRSRLLELGTNVDLHVVRLDMVHAFFDELRAHTRHEDELLYRWAEEHLDEVGHESLLAELGRALEARLTKLSGL